ncbi:PREDICTED: exosome complex component RRP4 homolog [Camelina sativa]|uniref:Exosome complex component RRP4 homolog n=1 Tax=Camelina sativa TaxID=90675 RepID=A0ABM0SRE0_CAMSA|nr:PREDICTED: exosome complex component RRP4 homolog [Camelina sativa]
MRKLQVELPLNQTQKVRFERSIERLQLLSSTTNNSVIVADSINEDAYLLKGHGTSEVDGELLATVCGVVVHVDKLVYVRNLRAKYKPEVNDVVVGRVIEDFEVSQSYWRVELNSTQYGVLKLSSTNMPDAVQKRKRFVDELNMRDIIVEDDVVCWAVIHRDGRLELKALSHKYGKLDNGELLKVDPYLVKKTMSHFHYLESLGIDLILGRNGFIWIGEHSQVKDPNQNIGKEKSYTPLETRQSILRIGNAIRVLSNLGFTMTLEVVMETVNLSNTENIDVHDMLGSEFHVLVTENEAERRR